MTPLFTLDFAKAYIDELRRQAQRSRVARQARAHDRRDEDHSPGPVAPSQPQPLGEGRADRKRRKAA